MTRRLRAYLAQPVSIAPLVVLRIAFGLLMCVSIVRFIARGWVTSMYVEPKVFFPYYGFEWIKPLGETGMYAVFVLMLLAAMGIMLGAFYRICSIAFFVLFSYVELIDKTNYLNHYYFISLISFLLMFMPAAGAFSFDNLRRGREDVTRISRMFVLALQLQMFLVYFFAGVAKINAGWLLEAQPLRTWLPAFSHLPLIGPFMEAAWVAYLFSWFACIYDLSIGFLLLNRRTVYVAYFFVVVFHLATALFFNIGMFPYIMMTITIVFFRESFHDRVLVAFRRFMPSTRRVFGRDFRVAPASPRFRLLVAALAVYFLVQVLMPFRYLLYSGNLFWTEQGYRFSWRVMLMEKAGVAFFTVRDRNTGASSEVVNSEFLTPMQEKMMATQPDMLVDYARFLKQEYESRGFDDPIVNAQCFVTLNGCGSREFVDPEIDLAAQDNSFLAEKEWVRSY